MKRSRGPADRVARLARLHDDALFGRAYAATAAAARAADTRLRRLARALRAAPPGAKTLFDDPAFSGAAGTAVAMPYSWTLARLLARRFPATVRVDLDVLDEPQRLAPLLRAARPLLGERLLADANVDVVALFRASARAAGVPPLRFLLDGVDASGFGPEEAERLWESAGLQLWWDVPDAASRTFLRAPAASRHRFRGPRLGRKDVSLAVEMRRPAPGVRRLSAREGAALLETANLALATRYRELHAFVHGDARAVWRASLGRGVTVWITGLAPGARLPLRAGFGYLVATNGVPTGYGDAHALFERLDLAFNVFPAFRAGESAFVFARAMRLLTAFTGTSSVHVDSFQLGLGNDEALDSGAFWFYRKLGFRCGTREAEARARREEVRLADDPGHRTSRAGLRRLAAGGLVWSPPGAAPGRTSLDRLLDRTAARTTAELLDALLPGRARTDTERRLVRTALREKESGSERRWLDAVRGLERLGGARRRGG